MGDSPEDIVAGIMAVCTAAHQRQPNAKILLLALLPRPDESSPRPTATERVNQLLPQRAAHTPWLTYRDFGAAFRNPDGSPNKLLFADGVHPNAAGYDILGRKIREELVKLMK